MLVHYDLQLLHQGYLVLRELIGLCKVLPNLCAQQLLFRVRLVATIGLDPFLYLAVAILNHANTFSVLAVFVGDFLLDETDLLGEVLDAVDPVVQDQTRVEGLGLRHPLDEVDGQVVSRHDC